MYNKTCHNLWLSFVFSNIKYTCLWKMITTSYRHFCIIFTLDVTTYNHAQDNKSHSSFIVGMHRTQVLLSNKILVDVKLLWMSVLLKRGMWTLWVHCRWQFLLLLCLTTSFFHKLNQLWNSSMWELGNNTTMIMVYYVDPYEYVIL